MKSCEISDSKVQTLHQFIECAFKKVTSEGNSNYCFYETDCLYNWKPKSTFLKFASKNGKIYEQVSRPRFWKLETGIVYKRTDLS